MQIGTLIGHLLKTIDRCMTPEIKQELIGKSGHELEWILSSMMRRERDKKRAE